MRSILLAPLTALTLIACSGSPQEPAALPVAALSPTAASTPTRLPQSAVGPRGRLIFTQGVEGLWQIDLSNGDKSQLWQVPDRAYLLGVAASPDGRRLALTYSPPPPEDTPILRGANLYLADAECLPTAREGEDGQSAGCSLDLQATLEGSSEFESYFTPAWSPDGEWVYYTHYRPFFDDQGTFIDASFRIERIPAAGGGTSEVVIESGLTPSLSADGSRIAFLRFNLETLSQSLWVASVDGSEDKQLLPDTAFFALAGPRLSPDGETIAFAASGPLQEALSPASSIFKEWFGVQVAHANGLPWEIWTISVDGGQPTQLTDWATDSPWPAWAPDGEYLAVLRPGGVFLLGSGEPRFLAEAMGHGELVWTSR